MEKRVQFRMWKMEGKVSQETYLHCESMEDVQQELPKALAMMKSVKDWDVSVLCYTDNNLMIRECYGQFLNADDEPIISVYDKEYNRKEIILADEADAVRVLRRRIQKIAADFMKEANV